MTTVRLIGVLATMLVAVPRAELVAGPPLDPSALARQIDEHLAARWRREKIIPAPAADDAEFLRRAYLDLTGRIPRPADVHEFLADSSADKRDALIDRLLEDPRYAVHQSNVWRAELIPETAADRQAALLQRGFENWLAEKFRARTSYDRLVRELIAVPLPHDKQPAEPVLRDPERPNPLAFLAAKNAKPENLAAAVTRTFLGVRLECAECHDHPFAKWSQAQFWQQAAFFGGITKQGTGLFAPLVEVRARRSVVSPHDETSYAALLLDGGEPQWSAERSSREYLADWITARDNPFFARAGANRIWGQLFGVGLVEPVDDFHDDNPPSDAELLELLAASFAESGFDVAHLTQAICRTEAYRRTSERTDPSQDETRLPARMTVKGLTGEQFFDSLALATGHRAEQDKGAAQRQFLNRFARLSPPGEPETSVQQALTLLNGSFVAWATDERRNPTLIAVTQTPGLTDEQQIEALYLATLSRKPTYAEAARLADQSCGDVFWLLLNSAEFRLNH